jgi:cellulose synthase/poly-beta-1,6-N-acetylglucosamine synthase-like glycosyltransferase/peptidoglycan/xylan/chitin deacetylase (PgdA/CDA1 family)/spore germination protein YaaH
LKDEKFIFHDAHGRRWTRFKIFAFCGSSLALLASILFVGSLFVAPPIAPPNSFSAMKSQISNYERRGRAPQLTISDRILSRLLAEKAPAMKASTAPVSSDGVRAGFFADWDEAAFRSLEKNGSVLTHLCPEWLTYKNSEVGIQDDPAVDMERIREVFHSKLMPVLSNLDGSRRVPESVEWLAHAGTREQKAFIDDLASRLQEVDAAGVVIDWEEVDAGEEGELSALVAAIALGLKAKGLETWLCVTMDSAFSNWDYDVLSPKVESFVAFLHDENGENDAPGPIASQDWVEGWLQLIDRTGNPGQWIASLACHGIDWDEGSEHGEVVSFADAMSRAGNAGCTNVQTTEYELNGTFSYYYEGKAHEVWFLDVASFANQWNAARISGLGGVAINRLGMEDPSIWKVLNVGSAISPIHLDKLMPGGMAITSIGNGEVVGLDPTTADGRRSFSTDSKGRILANYENPPAHPTLFRQGAIEPDRVAITFDDGPDPEWTPQILDILKNRGVKAAFFIVGDEGERNPDLVRRIVAEGHEIGNHSFTHPNLAEQPASMIRLQLNATQRLIESLTGRSTNLFRPPYNADSHPSKLEELLPISIAQSLGYMTILENIDPKDWEKPSSAELLERVKAARNEGHIILLHDGGGDRSATVEALPAIIDYLHERGDRITGIGELLGMDSTKTMPPLSSEGSTLERTASGIGFEILRWLQNFLHGFLVLGTILVVIRTILVLALARLHKKPAGAENGYQPPVSVIIPAFNEEKVISKTILSLLGSDYVGELEVLVVDDGSTDATAAAAEVVGDSRVRVVRQINAGKAMALQRAVEMASNEILVFVDADTQFESTAMGHLVAPFADSGIGAVSGHARVGNLRTFLARCQDLEYVCGFNLDRRAYAAWNCITVAPGAISAIRRSAVIQAGGFSAETLAEDTDLTLSIHKTGLRVEYQPAAVAHTEAPETFATLARQRFRWAYGTLQCVFKHADMLFNPRFKALGFFSLPGILFFQVLLVALSPFIDLLLLQSIFLGHSEDVLPYFMAFMLCDLLVAAVAVRFECLPLRTALRIIPQRFLYRPLLSYVIWKSLLHAVRGAWVGWGKLQRTATVSVP